MSKELHQGERSNGNSTAVRLGIAENKTTARTIKGPQSRRVGEASAMHPRHSGEQEAADKTDALPINEVDRAYFEQRAETELSLAQAAAHPAAVRAHYLMASSYLDRLYFGEQDSFDPFG